MMLNAMTVSTIASPGKSDIHHMPATLLDPSAMMLPQLAVGACHAADETADVRRRSVP